MGDLLCDICRENVIDFIMLSSIFYIEDRDMVPADLAFTFWHMLVYPLVFVSVPFFPVCLCKTAWYIFTNRDATELFFRACHDAVVHVAYELTGICRGFNSTGIFCWDVRGAV